MSDFTWDTLQDEQKEWQLANFGPQEPYRCLLGIIEECGELDAAANNQDYLDAVGDILIYTSGYCTAKGWRLHDIIALAEDDAVPSGFEEFRSFDHAMGQLCRSQLKMEQKIRGSSEEHELLGKRALGAMVWGISEALQEQSYYDDDDQFISPPTLLEIARETWEGVVKKRDWKKNPQTGA